MFSKPGKEKLTNTTFSINDFKAEVTELKSESWHKNYLFWSLVLLILSALIWIVFS